MLCPQAGTEPGLTQEAPESGWGVCEPTLWVWREQTQPNTHLSIIIYTELGAERTGRRPSSWRAALISTCHLQTPSPPRDTRYPSIKQAGKPQPPGGARGHWAALCQGAGRSFQESKPRAADPALFMLGQFNGPINFKTHTFPQAPASSAQCSGQSAHWEHRLAHRWGAEATWPQGQEGSTQQGVGGQLSPHVS